jgi:RHH-type rel operon transcriptional repressor/antitoxin RelB
MMVTLRLPKELEEKLDQLAKKEERSKTYIIRKALEEYLADYEDYCSAVEVLKSNPKIYTNEEATEILGY